MLLRSRVRPGFGSRPRSGLGPLRPGVLAPATRSAELVRWRPDPHSRGPPVASPPVQQALVAVRIKLQGCLLHRSCRLGCWKCSEQSSVAWASRSPVGLDVMLAASRSTSPERVARWGRMQTSVRRCRAVCRDARGSRPCLEQELCDPWRASVELHPDHLQLPLRHFRNRQWPILS